jgi:(S)-2-hydroxy-acid oxidase
MPKLWRRLHNHSPREDIAMSPEAVQAVSRRKLLQFLAASPLLAGTDFAAFAAERPGLLPDPMLWAPRTLDKVIASPK